jgi:hypothetical protein
MSKVRRNPGRKPKSTNVENFYDAHFSSRDPGRWPNVLRQAWEAHNQQTEPLPKTSDNWQSRGSRASQYNS